MMRAIIQEHRSHNGKYDFASNEKSHKRLCVCGHALAYHAAPNPTSTRPCFVADFIDEDASIPKDTECDCKHFKLKR